MQAAFQKDDTLLADIEHARLQPEALHVWWLGQSGFLVQWEGRHLLFDPYLSDSLTKKYAATDKPHDRMTELVVDPARLDFIDVVTSSHNHTDHLDAETLGPLLDVNASLTVVVPAANQDFAAHRLNVDPARLTPLCVGAPMTVEPFRLHAIPAAHEGLDRDEAGCYRYIGLVAEVGPWTIYHSGDTLWYDGLEDYLAPFDLDLMLLPINGRKPERRVAGNLDGEQAAQLAHRCGAKQAVPCHYDMFYFNTETPALFIDTATAIGQPYTVMRNGERLSLLKDSVVA
ncbi:MAG: MBL fold metallo-hydrolase [Bacteroidota bacterium]